MTVPPVALAGVHYAYRGGITALRGLDLDVPAGRRIALLGANGAGKTTALMHLNGSLQPSAGTVLLAGRPVCYDRAALRTWRCTVGLVFQDPDDQLFAGTVYEDVSFGPMNLGLDERDVRRRVDDALVEMDISALASRPIHMLSYGQKRRVALAGILAMRPRVIALDEPTAGLDAHGVAGLLDTLDALVGGGRSIVYSTHDVELAYAWSDRVVLLEDGVSLAVGPAERVLADRLSLARARLRMPFALDLALQARHLGLVGAEEPLPRSAGDLASLLRRLGDGCVSPAAAVGRGEGGPDPGGEERDGAGAVERAP
jgi:cobalt/nickel transport system ATP-binding protein